MPDHSPDEERAAPPPFSFPTDAGSRVSMMAAEGLDDISDDDKVKRKLGLLFWISSGWFAMMSLLAITANFLPIPDPNKPIACGLPRGCYRLSPGAGHIFGTDALARDIFSRVVYGGQVSLKVGFASIAIGLVVGGTIGIIAGYFRGPVEAVLMSMSDIVLAFPPLLLSLAVITFTDQRTEKNVIMAIAIVAIPPIARLVRANTLVFTQREFVLAARTLGASHARVILKEVLPNVILPILSFGIIGVAIAITAEGALAFLGLSVPPPTPTWGGMINEGRTLLDKFAYITLIPCTIMFLTILSLNLAGDRVREYFDVKEGLL